MNDDTQVLVVDDDTGIREGCCRILRRAGYTPPGTGNRPTTCFLRITITLRRF
jgi:DNA-binding NtrC family response regulator